MRCGREEGRGRDYILSFKIIDSFLRAHPCANLLRAAERGIFLNHGEPWVTLHKLSSPLHLLQRTPSVAFKALHRMTVFLTSPPASSFCVLGMPQECTCILVAGHALAPLRRRGSGDHLLKYYLSWENFPHRTDSFHLAQQDIHCSAFLPVPNT